MRSLSPPGIWASALGYFVCYAPYSALTKALSDGTLPGVARPLGGFELLPVTTAASLLAMFTFLTSMGWWIHAGSRQAFGVRIPVPGRWTLLSGVCTAGVIGTTTLAYTFHGVSIVFMMLLMRGGLLVLAPLVDLAAKRRVRWFSWCALGLSLAALLVTAARPTTVAMTTVAVVDVAVYLACYIVRLRFMTRLAKSDDPSRAARYFVEEQMVATPFFLAVLVALAAIGHGPVMLEVRRGFTDVWSSGGMPAALAVGVLSQGTGVFGGLILLDARENTFCVPVNRASSVLAGVVASLALVHLAGAPPLPRAEIAGAGLIVAAIAVLGWPTFAARFSRRSARRGT